MACFFEDGMRFQLHSCTLIATILNVSSFRCDWHDLKYLFKVSNNKNWLYWYSGTIDIHVQGKITRTKKTFFLKLISLEDIFVISWMWIGSVFLDKIHAYEWCFAGILGFWFLDCFILILLWPIALTTYNCLRVDFCLLFFSSNYFFVTCGSNVIKRAG